MTAGDYIKKAAFIKPSQRQLNWQRMEFYGFIHFGMNTFTDNAWGSGSESPELFNPSKLDADQWVDTFKSAGMKGLILTCKHHDGFCLWPSKYTGHSVKNSPWENGRGDVVREVSDACAKGGIKFGVYLSPWDRHDKRYGDSEMYNQYFKSQLTELLTGYGDIFSVWFDGACGEGPDGKRQEYDWKGYYEVVRRLQPGAVISVCGPDVRWCGNEAGHCRTSEWSVVPSELKDVLKIGEKSQKADNREFARLFDVCDEDLGSREAIRNAAELVWYPAEVNTSIRPEWFYHPDEDGRVKTLDELLNIYYGSVGGNACFLLNVPPDRRGLVHENDASRLREFGDAIKEIFRSNLAEHALAEASESMDEAHDACNVLSGDIESYWCPREGTEQAEVIIDFTEKKTFDRIVLMEHISSGQRVERFVLEYDDGDKWIKVYSGTVIGYKRICCIETTTSKRIRLVIAQSRWCPEISLFGVYNSG